MRVSGSPWRVALVLSATLAIACLPVHVDAPTVKRQLIHTDVRERPMDGVAYPIAMSTGSALSPDGQSLRLHLTVAQASRCSAKRVETWETTTTTRRTSQAGLLLAAGALATPFFVAGLVSHARGEPLSRKDGDSSSHLTGAGTMVLFGGVLGPPLLIEGIVGSIRSIDTKDTKRHDEVHEEVKACHASPAPDVPVTLLADGQPVSQRRTSHNGNASFELLRGELTQPPRELRLVVDAVPATLAPDLSTLLHTTARRWTNSSLPANAIATNSTTHAAAPETAPTAPEFGPRLFGVALASATRDSFERAIVAHGCARERVENRNVSHYDITCLNLPGFRQMKVLYDASERVVRVKYYGDLNADQRANMQRALSAEYGAASKSSDSSTSWQLPSGFLLELASKFFRTELAYVNLALDAELKAAIERHEEQKLNELKSQHGTAF
ncbi:MAG: hypothetical protein ACOY0T_34785 [Myxococcota bacterium]